MEETEGFIERSRRLYRKTLLEQVVPFWMKHGFDRTHGGISNILDDEGSLLGTDKYIWSQGRALWTFSALYGRVEKRPEWLAFADHIYRYLTSHGRDSRGRWVFRLDEAGNVLDADISIYADGFALNGLAEYYSATGNEDALKLALDTFDNTWARLNSPGSYGTAPHTIPAGMKPLGIPMAFSFFYYGLGKIAGRSDIREAGLRLAREIIEDFYVPERDALVEFVALDRKFVNSREGRTCLPGHCIEALWFLTSIFEETGEEDLVRTCCRLIRRHLELGWDEEYGGIRLALDVDGKGEPAWKNPDCKPWWPQVEALVATAYAYRHTREDWCLEWHRRIQDWAFSHYPVSSGEWTNWLDRTGRQKVRSGALPVKDPFHLPRSLIYLLDILGGL